jgi:WD40 repeat protein
VAADALKPGSFATPRIPSLNCAAFSRDGLVLALGIGKGIQVWRLVTDGRLNFQGVGTPVMSVALSSDGQTLAAGFWNGAIRLWNEQDGKLIQTIEGHTGSVNSLASGAGGRTLASGSDDKTVRVWNVAKR